MKLIITFLLIFTSLVMNGQEAMQYLVGYGKSDITYIEDSLGLFGYGNYHQRIDEADGFTSKLYSRVVAIKDPATQQQIIYLHADLGGIFQPLRIGLVEKIKANIDADFDDACLMMSASHTHCAPSGLSHYAMYMSVTPGYNPQLVDFIATKMYESVKQAIKSQAISTIEIKEGVFEPDVPVAFNRALKSYNKNKDIARKYQRHETNLALNRNMPLMSFVDEKGKQRGFINWFGVHPIEMMGDHNYIDGASKGYAALYAEEATGADVAIFAQSGAGDVMTSDYHNYETFEKQMRDTLKDATYKHDCSSLKQAKWNGKVQAEKALAIRDDQANLKVQGAIDYELIYVDLSNIEVDDIYSNGHKNARTSSPILGAPFLSGLFYWNDKNPTRRQLNFLSKTSKFVFKIRSPFVGSEMRQYRKILYKSQSPKKIVVNGEEKSVVGVKLENSKKGFSKKFFEMSGKQDLVIQEMNRQQALGALEEHTLLPKILPIQILRIGNIAIVGIPTEITTVAHNRLQKTILEVLKETGIEAVFINSYANEYAGYTTTYEEYLNQRYEGGHTLYGKHQLGAFQTEFKKLAKAFFKT